MQGQMPDGSRRCPAAQPWGPTEPQGEEPVTPKEKNECACGCGRETVRTFAPGHDAKVYVILRRVKLGEMEEAGIPVMVRSQPGLLEGMLAELPARQADSAPRQRSRHEPPTEQVEAETPTTGQGTAPGGQTTSPVQRRGPQG